VRAQPAPETPKPTSGELEILNVIWERGPSTVREVHDALAPVRGVGYTTVLKLMQIMADKGLLRREEQGRAHVYEGTVRREETQKRVVADLVEQLFGGSAAQLALHALSVKPATAGEMAEIRRLLKEHEGGRR
jgi:predicted transcriptional regulator